MWRPKNWEQVKPKKRSTGVVNISKPNFEYGVEVGADAILEALEREADGRPIWFGRTTSGDLLIYVGIKIIAKVK